MDKMNVRDEKGSILLENILAMLIMTVAGLALVGMVQRSMVVTFKAREQVNCTRLVQTGFARLKSLDFYYLFAADSSQADYGLQSGYPYRSTLEGLTASLSDARFDRFRIEVEFMRRDFSDADSDGSTADLLPFTDLDVNLEDDSDPNIRYFDQNGDGDYYDTYTAGGRIVAEQPDTHIKKVTLDIFRSGRLACSQTEYVSLEQFTGEPNPSSESVLRLLVNTPANGGFVYNLNTAAQQNAWNLLKLFFRRGFFSWRTRFLFFNHYVFRQGNLFFRRQTAPYGKTESGQEEQKEFFFHTIANTNETASLLKSNRV